MTPHKFEVGDDAQWNDEEHVSVVGVGRECVLVRSKWGNEFCLPLDQISPVPPKPIAAWPEKVTLVLWSEGRISAVTDPQIYGGIPATRVIDLREPTLRQLAEVKMAVVKYVNAWMRQDNLQMFHDFDSAYASAAKAWREMNK